MKQFFRIIYVFLIIISPDLYASKDEASRYYEKALTEFEKTEYKNAVIYLKNAIQQDSKYLSAYVLLGRAYLEIGDGAGAEKELRRAKHLGADINLVYPPLAKALLIQNKPDELLSEIPESGASPEIQSELFVYRGEAYTGLRNFDKAFKSYERARSLTPRSSQVYLGLAAVSIQQKDFNKAEELISRAMDFDQKSANAWQLKAQIQYANSNINKALKYYTKALTFKPDHLAALLGRAGTYFDLKQYNASLEDLAVLKKKFPLDPRSNYLRFSVNQTLGNTEDSQLALSDTNAYLQKIPQNNLTKYPAMLLLAGIVSFELKQTEKAHKYLSTYVKKYPDDLYAELTLGKILLSRGESREAVQILESANIKQPNDYNTLTLLGTAYMNSRLYTKANEFFEQAISLKQNSSAARIQKAFNELNFGHQQNALTELEKLYLKNGDPRAGLMLVSLYFKQNEPAKAAIFAEKILDKNKQNLLARNMLGVAQIELKEHKKARKNFEIILKQDPDHFPAQMNIVKLDVLDNKFEPAKNRLTKLLETKKNLATVLTALSRIAIKENKRDEALRWAEKAYDADNENVSAIIHLSNLYLELKLNEKALRTADKASISHPKNLRIKAILGRSYIAANKLNQARSIFREMAKLASYDSQKLYDIARMQYSASDIEGGMWSLRKSIEGDEENTPARIALIETLLSINDLTSAKKEITDLRQFSNDAVYYRLQGDWELAAGNPKKSIDWYTKAHKSVPDTIHTQKLFEALAGNKQLKQGISLLENHIKKDRHNFHIKNLLAEAYIHNNENKKAIRLLEEVINIQPEHTSALNNLAYLYHSNNNPDAVILASKAQSLSPNNPAYNDTLGWILVQNKKPEEGLLHLRNAHTLDSGNNEIRYHIAYALHKMGRNEEALSELSNLLKTGSGFPAKTEALKLFDKLNK